VRRGAFLLFLGAGGFRPVEDPAAQEGSDEERLQKLRAVRDQIDKKIADCLAELTVRN
jgi:hypothetical protein